MSGKKRSITPPVPAVKTVVPHLFALMYRGTPLLTIAAKGKGEATTYLRDAKMIELVRLTPVRAAQVGATGAAIEYANPDYAESGLGLQQALPGMAVCQPTEAQNFDIAPPPPRVDVD